MLKKSKIVEKSKIKMSPPLLDLERIVQTGILGEIRHLT
jgi:hypothetical protein